MSDLNISNFIWNIADDVLRDVYVRGKYRDVILPMTVIRRLDAVLEPTKDAVLAMKVQLDKAGVANQHAALCQASGEAFYNTSQFRLRDLTSRARRQQLKSDFEAYLDGFSPNVQEVLDKFKFRNQIPTLVEADALGFLIEKFLDPSVNLSPKPVLHQDGSLRLPGLDNHSMGTIFEELIRRFNEENNEEAGEHFTPRDVVELMAYLIFMPIADEIQSGTYLVYDGACGTGGMLTVAEETLIKLATDHGKEVSVHLYGQEVNPETFAISKADLILKGEGAEAENMKYGSTLSSDAFPSSEFDFMLSNPPYGKSWKSDLDRLGGKKDITDPRFVIEHDGYPEYSLITRSSDGQMVFLANMLSKMKKATKVGSRIAEVHNGSSLFTGDAGSGESNVRRWVIENDWLEAIIALPLNIFYNTGIATYIWVLSNRKAESRKGKVQLIDATAWFKPLRKNLGKKNCILGPDDIKRICDSFLNSEESEQSKIFPNAAFGFGDDFRGDLCRQGGAGRFGCYSQLNQRMAVWILDHAEPLVGVEEGAGAREDPDMLGDRAGLHAEEDQRTGSGVGGRHLDHHASRAVGQHLARASLAPVAAVGRDRERLGADDLAPDAAGEAKAVTADAAQARLVVIRRAEP